MKIALVFGGRSYDEWSLVNSVLIEERPDMIIQGGADGADMLASRWARDHDIIELRVPAKWRQFGKSAGPNRNWVMVKLAWDFQEVGHDVVAVKFAGGRGTNDCLQRVKNAGLRLREVS